MPHVPESYRPVQIYVTARNADGPEKRLQDTCLARRPVAFSPGFSRVPVLPPTPTLAVVLLARVRP